MDLQGPETANHAARKWHCGYLAGGSQEVTLYERTPAIRKCGASRWLLVITNRGGRVVDRFNYKTTGGVWGRIGKLFGTGVVHIPGLHQ
jgi:hypothetical protein